MVEKFCSFLLSCLITYLPTVNCYSVGLKTEIIVRKISLQYLASI